MDAAGFGLDGGRSMKRVTVNLVVEVHDETTDTYKCYKTSLGGSFDPLYANDVTNLVDHAGKAVVAGIGLKNFQQATQVVAQDANET